MGNNKQDTDDEVEKETGAFGENEESGGNQGGKLPAAEAPEIPPSAAADPSLAGNEEAEVSGTTPKLDISFYNSSARTTLRLAICLDGIRCDGGSPAKCLALQQKCNEGIDVSGTPGAVRVKLSECQVDDILCHLEASRPVLECQQDFEVKHSTFYF